MYYGDFVRGATVRIPWNTSGASGASITRATDGTIHVYKDGVDSTEVTTGVTSVEDHDGNVGTHLTTIDTTDAFYTTGSSFQVKLKGAVIDGQTVNAWIGSFSLDRASAIRDLVAATPPTALAIGQEVLNVLLMRRGNRVTIDGTDIVGFDTDGTTEISRQPFTRLPAPANPIGTIG